MKRERLHQAVKNIGYDIVDKHYVVNKIEATNIINLYKYFISVNGNIQETYKYFIEHFNEKGQDALSKYLRETSYIGKYKLYRKEIFLENYIPRIMEDDLFYSVQDLLKKKEKIITHNKSFSLFSGLVYCNICNKRMSKKQDNRSKDRLMRYICDNAYRLKVGSLEHRCTNNKLIRETVIEQYLLNNLEKELNDSKLKVQIKNSSNTINNNSIKIKTLEKKINKLKDLYLEDLIDKETYRKDYAKYNNELKELQKNTTPTLPKKDFSSIEKILNSNYKTIYNNLTTENKRKFWLSFIDKIYIENGEIKEVTFL